MLPPIGGVRSLGGAGTGRAVWYWVKTRARSPALASRKDPFSPRARLRQARRCARGGLLRKASRHELVSHLFSKGS
jgi:hypothetical protein